MPNWSAREQIMTDTPELTATETLYGFCGWLTSRDESVTMGATHECGTVVDLIKRYMDANNLPDVTERYPNNLRTPGHD